MSTTCRIRPAPGLGVQSQSIVVQFPLYKRNSYGTDTTLNIKDESYRLKEKHKAGLLGRAKSANDSEDTAIPTEEVTPNLIRVASAYGRTRRLVFQ